MDVKEAWKGVFCIRNASLGNKKVLHHCRIVLWWTAIPMVESHIVGMGKDVASFLAAVDGWSVKEALEVQLWIINASLVQKKTPSLQNLTIVNHDSDGRSSDLWNGEGMSRLSWVLLTDRRKGSVDGTALHHKRVFIQEKTTHHCIIALQ